MPPNVEHHATSLPRPDARSVDDQNKIALLLSILLRGVGTEVIRIPQPHLSLRTPDNQSIAHLPNPAPELGSSTSSHCHNQHIGDEDVPLLLDPSSSSPRLRGSPQPMSAQPLPEEGNGTDAFQATSYLVGNRLGRRRESSNSNGGKPSKGNRKALLIGITYRQTKLRERTLLMPWKDVERMKQVLIELYHYEEKDIVIMTDEPATPSHLQPEQANILREISRLVQNPDAGHATQRKERIQGNERDHMDECLIPVDAVTNEGEINTLLIVDDDLHSTLIQPLTQAQAVMDTCTSGTLLVHITYSVTSEDLRHDLCNERRLRKVSIKHLDAVASLNPKGDFCNGNCRITEEDIKPNIICLSACRDSQSIVESRGGDTLAGALDNYLRGKKCPPLGELFPDLRQALSLTRTAFTS
ncbi:hypothetical protein AGABI2DRAFT_120405 [Agaricus bisporus var. bisporus H97]|uniref:hypothetical protein n=1 Tax=Agaricus bisporus var. bisporus (strain H97 / ATCC MYA-4626 / FGSC 10389) TaxID=936046 RepID=UPI00029F7590|nr:hypothetical protein AGABI2DRAFT_120405 [Agaricus bisporus var. bisporus H97]EKV45452.1 hypothetical protein AGABI2DRAFT_120405 [Agaricus bisporus var. bisporus H97]